MSRFAVALVLLGGVCAGCTGSDYEANGVALSVERQRPVLATGSPLSASPPYVEVTSFGDGEFGVLTFGSGSCPNVPVSIERLAVDQVRVRMEERSRDPDAQVCTTDSSPSLATMRLPDGVDGERPLTVVLSGDGVGQRERSFSVTPDRPTNGLPGPEK